MFIGGGEALKKFGIIFGTVVVFSISIGIIVGIMAAPEWKAVSAEQESSMNTIILEREQPVVIQKTNEAPKELLPKEFKRQVLKDTTGYKLDDFQIFEQIGTGGYGVVYKAFNKRTNKTVALKAHRFGREGGRSIKRQFVKERRFLQLLQDVPFVCKLIWHTQISKKEAMAMFQDEKLQGILVMDFYPKDLYDTVIQQMHWDYTTLKKWLSQIVIALQHIHARGLLHRDIKLQNMLLSESNDVYLCDFGMSKRYKQNAKNLRAPGTPVYMAPEIMEQKGASRASDIFALGVSLYKFIVKDKASFENGYVAQLHVLMLAGNPTGMSNMQKGFNRLPVSPKTPAELDDLFKRMTEADPKKRITIPQIMEHPFFKDVDWKRLGAL